MKLEKDLMFSIILPFYNAEKTIERSIQSVLKQNFENYELLCINDGSTDSSEEIVKGIQETNSHIYLIQQENGGCSEARNKGLEIAKGKYILFLDADDRFCDNILQRLYKLLQGKDYDFVCYGYEIICSGFVKHTVIPENRMIDGTIRENGNILSILDKDYFPVVWNKVYSRVLLKTYALTFNTQLKYGEDYSFNLKYLKYCNCTVMTDEILYQYHLDNPESVTNRFDTLKYHRMILYFDYVKEILETFAAKRDEYEIWLQSFYIHCCYSCYLDLFRPECRWSFLEKWDFVNKTKKSPIKRYSLKDNKKLGIKKKVYNSIFALQSPTVILWSAKLFYTIKKHSSFKTRF